MIFPDGTRVTIGSPADFGGGLIPAAGIGSVIGSDAGERATTCANLAGSSEVALIVEVI